MHVDTKTNEFDMPIIVIRVHCSLRVSMQVHSALLAAVITPDAVQTDYRHQWAHGHTYLR